MSYYPLLFHPQYKDKIWGGTKIKTVLNKDYGDLPNCGETWEISAVKENISIVKNGEWAGQDLLSLIEKHQEKLLGEDIFKKYGVNFPLLVKFIDAAEDLSIQVHPNDEVAKKRHNSFGKTEMWYILQADKDASLISGFNRALTKNEFLTYFNEGKIEEVLNREKAEAGDVFYLPAGRIHTIGKGLLLTEIQQTSDITYRIYDFDRTDAKGNKRELHIQDGIEALDFQKYPFYKTPYNKNILGKSQLVDSPYFQTHRWVMNQTHRLDISKDRFSILIITSGSCDLRWNEGEMKVKMGDAILLPSAMHTVEITPHESCSFLETYAM